MCVGDDILVLTIDPKGLLTPNMLVKGQIELYDSIGEIWIIEIELKAENENSNGFQYLLTPGNTIGIACIRLVFELICSKTLHAK